ncbi:MAG TPA: hypothetical protein DFS52_19085 [Myxococcales bacterium]|jgi:hypothetical protein|nr:hypothetical protein [Myxococcales bacterium]
MADTVDPKVFDKRLVGRNLKKGLLDPKDYERYLKSLPDLAGNAANIEATVEPTQVVATGSHPEED